MYFIEACFPSKSIYHSLQYYVSKVLQPLESDQKLGHNKDRHLAEKIVPFYVKEEWPTLSLFTYSCTKAI